MSDLKIRGCPWMTYPSSSSHYTDASYKGWHPGQKVLVNRSRHPVNTITMDGITWWGDSTSADGDMSPDSVFTSTGSATELYNGVRHNTCFFLGAEVHLSGFLSSTHTYGSGSKSSMIRNAIGFGCENSSQGSYSDSKGAQAFLEKVGLFYADPSTYKRVTFIADHKLSGNQSLNNRYDDQSWHHYAYRISSENIQRVKNEKLVLMGMALQFVHDYKTAAHTSRCTIKNMRMIVGDGTGLVGVNSTNRILLLDSRERTLQQHKDNSTIEIGMN